MPQPQLIPRLPLASAELCGMACRDMWNPLINFTCLMETYLNFLLSSHVFSLGMNAETHFRVPLCVEFQCQLSLGVELMGSGLLWQQGWLCHAGFEPFPSKEPHPGRSIGHSIGRQTDNFAMGTCLVHSLSHELLGRQEAREDSTPLQTNSQWEPRAQSLQADHLCWLLHVP